MPGSRLSAGSQGAFRRAVVASLSWMLCIAAGVPALAQNPRAGGARQPALVAPDAASADAEIMLIEVYKALGANNLRGALEKADRLVEAYPTFRLGHLIRGDLLMMQTRPVKSMGPAGAPREQLDNLRAEAAVRLRFLRERPNPELVPRQVLQLRDDQTHVLLVDAKRSRLFVYANQGGRLKFVTDYYVSQGKYGVHKLREGDQKTPVGVYYITGHLPGARLPDFYGPGALPINYPNEWDKLHGRDGSGIWLHGTPSDSYSRPPLSSDGCVVLTNPDLQKLTSAIDVGRTPVVISESIDFISKGKWEQERKLAARLVDDWRRDVESLSSSRVKSNYSRQFKSDRGEDLNTWFAKQQYFLRGARKLAVKLSEITHFYYPEREDLIVSTFTMESQSGKARASVRKRQYWSKDGGQWKIIYELNL
jgi:murein L,D-transpeptidase YafK